MNQNEQSTSVMDKDEICPKVFISYSWTSTSHQEWVLNLANRLVEDFGVDVTLDQWHGIVGHDRFSFMEKSIVDSDKVVVVCDKLYSEKANGRLGGVGTESMILTPQLYESTEQTKIIPICVEKSEEGKYLLPTFFTNRFILPMTPDDNFEDSLVELARLIWEEPAKVPPLRGKKPDFSNLSSSQQSRPIFRETDEETVIWLLPRGFLILTDLTFSKSASWSVTANYYDYNGNWQHGTHYHDSYERSWSDNIENQFRKLSIPKGDWHFAYTPLNFLMDIRKTEVELDIKELVDVKNRYDYFVQYYKAGEQIELPIVPNDYVEYNKSGAVRDILAELNSLKVEKLKNPINEITVLRQEIYLVAYKYFGENHPSFRFIKEVIDEFNNGFDKWDLKCWCDKINNVLATALYNQ